MSQGGALDHGTIPAGNGRATAGDGQAGAARPEPRLHDAPPGRGQMLRDWAWLVGALVRLAPRPSLLLAATALGQGLLVPAQLWLTKTLVDALAAQVRGGGGTPTSWPLWLTLLVATLLGDRLLGSVQPWLQARVREVTGAALQERVMRTAAGLDLAAFEQQAYYDQLNRVMSNAETRGPQVLANVITLVRTVPAAFGYAAALAALTPFLLAIALAAMIPTVLRFVVGGQANWNILRGQTQERRLGDYYASLLTGRDFAKEVRLYGLAGHALERWEALFWQTRNEQRRLQLRLELQQRAWLLGSSAIVLLGLLWIVAAGITRASAGTYALLFQALDGMIKSLFSLSGALATLGEHSGFAADCRAFFSLPVEPQPERVARGQWSVVSWLHPMARQEPFGCGSPPLRGLPASPSEMERGSDGGKREAIQPAPIAPLVRLRLVEGVRFEDVWFTYPGASQPAVAGVSFTIRAGEKVALVGENGAGKTTLVKLLLGLYTPDAGRVTFDGRDVRELDQRGLRAAASAVFQQFVRYQLTLAVATRRSVPGHNVRRLRLSPRSTRRAAQR